MTIFAILVGMFPMELPECSSRAKTDKSAQKSTNESLSQQLKGSLVK